MKILSRNSVFILVHVFCWLILAAGVLYAHPSDWGSSVPRQFWIRQTVLLVILVAVFYFNLYLLIPRLLFHKKVLIYIGVAIALVAGVTELSSTINSTFNLNMPMFNRQHQQGPPPLGAARRGEGPHGGGRPERRGHYDTFVPSLNLLVIGLGITISFIQKWQQEVQLRQQLEKEKIAAELSMLKAQINPHFFFNTLNNIYAYTLSDGDVARTAITNLSKMMRYVLYDGADGQTSLSKEVAFIEEYTALMKLRIGKKTTVTLEVPEFVTEAMIAPMMFLPFVENAFKHGVSSIKEGFIAIKITQKQQQVELIVTNTVYEGQRASEDDSNGIGIQNTTRRLELLYPGKYELTSQLVNESEYTAKLTLTI